MSELNSGPLPTTCGVPVVVVNGGVYTGDHVKDLSEQCNKLAAFKRWVHAWLDAHGVPAEFPDGPHTREGCRIGDRMEWLWDKVSADKLKGVK